MQPSNQFVDPKVEVVPMFKLADTQADAKPDSVGLVITGGDTSGNAEQRLSFVLSPDVATDVARQLGGTAEIVRRSHGAESN